MNVPRISASSYSNTAPLVWSFLYGRNHGKVELVLDNAPTRSAEALARESVDAALVPVIAFQLLDNVRLIPDVCIGATEKVRSVCLVTRGKELTDVRSVALDISSQTSVFLTKIIFREFIGFEPAWSDAEPDPERMLDAADCALIIGDPALRLSAQPEEAIDPIRRIFDLAELWKSFTGLGFVFAMWMTRYATSPIDFAGARDEGMHHIEEIVSNYAPQIGLNNAELTQYLLQNISYSIDESMQNGLELFFELAKKHRLCENSRHLKYVR